LRPVECFQLEIEVNRLHFLDADDAICGVDREPVDAAGDRDIPILVHYAMDHMDFRAVIHIVGGAQLRAATVDVLPDPHPAETVATFHSDPTIGRRIDEITNGA